MLMRNFLVKGLIENDKKLDLENKFLSYFKFTFPKLELINLNLNSKNKFSFRINKKSI